MKNIAIQGIKGSFHHQVAKDYFSGALQIVECDSFGDLIHTLTKGECTEAVMAIENSIAGAILPNYALIDQHDVRIEGEYYLNIEHQLMALKGQQIEDITEVWSHPMAHLQCRHFFNAYPHIKLVEEVDTAYAAQQIQSGKLKGIAAIASEAAATMYDLAIIERSIQTIKDNATRFFILNTTAAATNENADKASLRFTTEHKRGSLATILNVLSDCKLNLTKIQSMPIIETPWKYAFFVDVTFEQYAHYAKAKKVMKIMATDFKVLGEYKNKKE